MGTQNITPSASIPSSFSGPSPYVGALITPSAIASSFSAPTPAVQGPGQFLNLTTSVPSSFSVPNPTLTGGNLRLRLYIGGVDVSVVDSFAAFSPQGAGSNASACTIQSQTIGRATLTFDFINFDGGYTPYLGQTVRVTEGGLTLFAGCLDTIVTDLEPGSTNKIVYHCTALDKSSICDHRVIKTITYPSGTPIQSVVLNIVATSLNGEGVTTQGVPASMGNLSSDLPFNYDPVTDGFNRIGTLAGMVWWIDFFGILNFSPLNSLIPAPWGVTSLASGDIRRGSGGGFLVQTLSGSGALSGYRNRQFVVTNRNVLPGANGGSGATGVTETFVWTNGTTGIISQYVSGVLTPVSIQVSLALGSIQSITVNGNPQTVVEYSQFNGQTSTGPNDYLWFYTSNQSEIVSPNANITTPTFGPIPPGATVVIIYLPGGTTSSAASAVGSALVPTDPFGGHYGTCGSGIYENVQQVKDISSQADLDVIAAAILVRSGGIPTIFQFETDKPGLAVGQAFSVFLPEIQFPATGITPETVLITQVNGTSQGSQIPNYGSFFRWQITAISNFDSSNWVTYFTNLIAQTNNPLPILDIDPIEFIINPGSSISAGVISTNPLYAKRTGLVFELYAGATVAPVDQDMIITFTDVTQGTTIGSVKIPAGDTSRQFTEIPSILQVYIFVNDQITVTVVYNQTGASPVAAQSVTAGIKLTM